MNLQKIFNYGESELRTVVCNNEPWFVAKDVCDILEISNPTMALQRLDEDERSKFNLGRQGETNIVNESGLYELVFGSRKQEAQDFKRWIKREVLPSIRKNGSYGVNKLPSNYVEALEALVEQVKCNQELSEKAALDAPKVALYDTAMSANNNFTMERVSKTIGYGRNKLFAFLREHKILRTNNLPYQEFIDRGYFDVRQYTVTHLTSGVENKTQTLITPKGMAYIHKMLIEHGVLKGA
jgi:anti-repressor protein